MRHKIDRLLQQVFLFAGVLFIWNHDGQNLAGFKIYVSENENFQDAQVIDVADENVREFRTEDLDLSKRLYARITAYSPWNVESGTSNEIQFGGAPNAVVNFDAAPAE